MTEELSHYKSRAIRALVLLHEKHLRQCFEVWKQTKAANIKLPRTNEEKYQSLETLLGHIFHSAGKYLVGMCQLQLPNPDFRPVPALVTIEAEARMYLEHVLERWRLSLIQVPKHSNLRLMFLECTTGLMPC